MSFLKIILCKSTIKHSFIFILNKSANPFSFTAYNSFLLFFLLLDQLIYKKLERKEGTDKTLIIVIFICLVLGNTISFPSYTVQYPTTTTYFSVCNTKRWRNRLFIVVFALCANVSELFARIKFEVFAFSSLSFSKRLFLPWNLLLGFSVVYIVFDCRYLQTLLFYSRQFIPAFNSNDKTFHLLSQRT